MHELAVDVSPSHVRPLHEIFGSTLAVSPKATTADSERAHPRAIQQQRRAIRRVHLDEHTIVAVLRHQIGDTSAKHFFAHLACPLHTTLRLTTTNRSRWPGEVHDIISQREGFHYRKQGQACPAFEPTLRRVLLCFCCAELGRD